MKVSKTPSTIKVKLNDTKLEQVKNCKYLRTLNENSDTETEIKSRIEQARQSFMKWKNLLCNRRLRIETKLRALKCYVWPILLYGVEAWTIKQTMIKKIRSHRNVVLSKNVQSSPDQKDLKFTNSANNKQKSWIIYNHHKQKESILRSCHEKWQIPTIKTDTGRQNHWQKKTRPKTDVMATKYQTMD